MKQLLVTLALLGTVATRIWGADTVAKPNIIVILADDLGFGDTGCYGATKIPTPNIDRLGREGLRFTDAHATSATCTPSRYALLTGQYPWRRPGTGVLSGTAALIINPQHATLPSILRGAGYRTGIVGKWHLGLGGPGGPDWNGDIRPGPLEVGFDYAFIQPATGDRVPCVYVEDHHVAGLDPKDPIRVSYDKPFPNEPTGRKNPELVTMHTKKGDKGHSGTILDGIARIGYMTGGRAAYWKDATKAEVLTAKAVNFIAQNSNGPFFLEFAAHDPHVPRVPAPQFVGKSGCGVRGDVIVEFDWSVGQILETLRQLHLTTNTLVILTSDNGPVIQDGYDDGAQMNLNGHTPAGPLRGGKYSVYEGGTRVPFLVSWPGRVSPGVSDALVSLVDFTASFAALTGQTIPAGDAPDSRNLLAALLGETRKGRDTLVEHDGMSMLGFRDGQWKLIQPGAARRYDSEGELYDLAHDLGETNNLQPIRPEMNGKLAGELKAETDQGRAK
jgi:arylsulfatase A-like enzyme